MPVERFPEPEKPEPEKEAPEGDSQDDWGSPEPIEEPQPGDFAGTDDDGSSLAEKVDDRFGEEPDKETESKTAREILDSRSPSRAAGKRKSESILFDILVIILIAVVFMLVVIMVNQWLGGAT